MDLAYIVNELMNRYRDLKGVTSYIDRATESTTYYEDSKGYDEIELEDFKLNIKSFREPSHPPELEGIVAIDSSSYRIGDTNEGYISVFRGTIIEEGSKNIIMRFGPYIIHVTNQSSLDILNRFRSIFGLEPISTRQLPSLNKVSDRIRNYFERILQLHAASTFKNHMIFIDGSLMGGTIDTPYKAMDRIISVGLRNRNHFIGLSKSSSLRLKDGRPITSLIPNYIIGYIEISGYISYSVRSKVFGNVYVARFTMDGEVFRVDVKPFNISGDDILSIVYSKMDFVRGYPYLLYLSHVYSVFRRRDIIAIKSYIFSRGVSTYGSVDRSYLLPKY